MVGLEAVPAALYLCLWWAFLKVPDGWPYTKRFWRSQSYFTKSDANNDAAALVEELKGHDAQKAGENILLLNTQNHCCWPFGCLFNQASGINFIIYYAPRVFAETGMDASSSLMATIGIGVANLILPWLELLWSISWEEENAHDHWFYRVTLFHCFGFKCIYNNAFNGVEWFVFLFIAAHAIGQGSSHMGIHLRNFSQPVQRPGAVFWYRSTLGGKLPSSPHHALRAQPLSGRTYLPLFGIMMILQIDLGRIFLRNPSQISGTNWKGTAAWLTNLSGFWPWWP